MAECLARARFGFWSEDRRTFFPDSAQNAAFGIRWGVMTKEVKDLGVLRVSFVGASINAIRFSAPWPKAQFRPGSHFMDKRFRLPLAEDSTTIFRPQHPQTGWRGRSPLGIGILVTVWGGSWRQLLMVSSASPQGRVAIATNLYA